MSNLTRLKYWILFEYLECTVCGRDSVLRTRMYTKKPKNLGARHFYRQKYDYCELG